MANPVGYSDLFNFSDRDIILQAIADMKELRTAYKDFVSSVTGGVISKFETELQSLSAEVQKLAKASEQLNVTNEKGQQVLLSNLKTVEQQRIEIIKLKEAKAGAQNVETTLAGSVAALDQKLRDQIKTWKTMQGITESDIQARKRLATEIGNTRTEINALNATTKATKTIVDAANGSYNLLDQQTKQLIKDYKALADIEGVNKGRAAELSSQISANTAILKKYDEQIGHNFRNVGNYKSAFNGLGNSINQISRELPSFANSIQTGFLAISNNLPIFSDEINRLREKNAQLNAEGIKTPSVFKSVVSALFSWQTAMSLGITVLTVYGKDIVEWIGSLFSGAKAIDTLKLKQQDLNAVMADANKQAGNQIATLNNYYNAAVNVNLSMKDRLDAVNRLKSAFPEYFAQITNETILNGKAEASYKALRAEIVKTAQVTAAQGKLGELESQRLAAEEQRQKILNARAAELARVPKSTRSVVDFNFVSLEDQKKFSKEQLLQMQREADERGQANIVIDRTNKALKSQDDIIKSINSREDFLVKFVGVQNLLGGGATKEANDSLNGLNQKLSDLKKQYDALSPSANNYKKISGDLVKQIRDTETQIKKMTDAISIKPDTTAAKAERDFERAIKKQDELIQASAKLRIAQEELRFAKSAQTADDEILLENNRLKILHDSYDLRLRLYKKDSKDYQAILAEKVDAEKNNLVKIRSIHDKDLQQTARIDQARLNAQYQYRNLNYDQEVEFEQKSLAIATNAFDQRLKLYDKDSDEYKQILADKIAAEDSAAARIQKINEDRDKAINKVRKAQVELQGDEITGRTNLRVAKKEITRDQGDELLHSRRMALIGLEIEKRKASLEFLTEGDKDYYDKQAELVDLQKQLVDERYNYEIKKAEEAQERKKELERAAFDFAAETAGQLFDLGRQINESNIENLQREKDQQLAIAGNNAVARARIEENFQKKIVDLKRKQAIYDKLQGLFDVGINTAVAISKAIAASPLTFGQPFVTYAIVQGALQAAAIIAKPLPKYKKGRKGGRAEYAELNEEGPEMIVDNKGRLRFENRGRPGIGFVNEGESVKTAQETKQIFEQVMIKRHSDEYTGSINKANGVLSTYAERKDKERATAIHSISEAAIAKAFDKSIKNIPINLFEVNERGLRKYSKSLAGKVELMNERK
jgi:hypothetical protein